jgi:PIN domain nuclease of toxin-antitoxin system
MRGLLLDTHVWIWLLEGASELTPYHQNLINKAAKDNMIGVAAISLWEISMLVAKDRIHLEKPVLAWIKDALALPGIELLSLTPEIAVESCQLPDGFHGDPADRLLVATARMHQLTLVTYDQKIVDYAQKKYVSVS